MIPAIDHSGLSRIEARQAWLKIQHQHDRLFPPGYWDEPAVTPDELRKAEIASLKRHAARLHDLANRGMSVRKFRKEAATVEARIASAVMSRFIAGDPAGQSDDFLHGVKKPRRNLRHVQGEIGCAECHALDLIGPHLAQRVLELAEWSGMTPCAALEVVIAAGLDAEFPAPLPDSDPD